MLRRLVLSALLAGLLLSAPGCLQRWVYIAIESTPAGARVQVQGLGNAPPLRRPTTPTGHYLPCTVDAVHPDVRVRETDWRYRLTLPEHNAETLYVLRRAVAPFCADSRKEARARPFRLRASLLRVTTEPGLRNEVLLRSSPSGAIVRDARTGRVLGRTPLRRTFVFYAPYTMVYRVRLTAPGYPPVLRTITAQTFALDVSFDGAALPRRSARGAPPAAGSAPPSRRPPPAKHRP